MGVVLMVCSIILRINQNTNKFVYEIISMTLLISMIPLIKSIIPLGGLRHLYAINYITNKGYVPLYYPHWRSNVYSLWYGSYILLTSIQLLTGMNLETIYTLFLPIIGTLGVVIFYFFIKNITYNSQLS